MRNITSGKFQILELVACSDLYPAAAQAKAEKYGCKAMTSAETSKMVTLESTFETPAGLPSGYMGDGGWPHKEESALA